MRVLSVWSWQDFAEAPTLLRRRDFLAVLWRETPDGVGFALSPNVPTDLRHPDLRDRELLLFGYDPARPDAFILIKDGKVQ